MTMLPRHNHDKSTSSFALQWVRFIEFVIRVNPMQLLVMLKRYTDKNAFKVFSIQYIDLHNIFCCKIGFLPSTNIYCLLNGDIQS